MNPRRIAQWARARVEGAFVSHRKRHGKRRAPIAPADSIFEQTLYGTDDDGRKRFNPREDRKTLQLCRQVHRALILGLAGECADDVLPDVYVVSVEPMGGAAQLLVRVAVPSGNAHASSQVLGRLNERASTLRTIVAQSICRKRAPGLTFICVPDGADGGQP